MSEDNSYSTTTNEDTIKQRCDELKRRIESLKEKCDTLFEKLSVYVYKNDLDNCYLCIGSLKNNFTDSYNIVEEILETVTSHIVQLEYHVEQLEYRVEQLELDKNSVKFLGIFRDWVHIFIDLMTARLGEGDWNLVEKILVRLSTKYELTEQQDKCLKELESLLEGVGMTLNDVNLLRDVKDQSNFRFHSNDQSFDQVKRLLLVPVPEEMNQYKPSLQKALEAICTWSPGKITSTTRTIRNFRSEMKATALP